ncbi:MAG: hypothetical protein GY820_02455 [Gammaproteobacteria bacterium]|nr:hypothetical protein [Gammaproteobacteria bacterium]
MDSDSEQDDFYDNCDEFSLRRKRKFKNRINFTPDNFSGTFRFTRVGIAEILRVLGPHLQPETGRSFSLSSEEQLLIGIRFYATNGFYKLVGDAHGVSEQTVCQVVKRVTRLINEHLFRNYVKWPDDEANRQATSPLASISLAECPRWLVA